jgi:hypothetical protein
MADGGRFSRLSPMKGVGAAAAIVGLVGGVVALVFTLAPGLRPCLGNSASFIAAPVFPGEHFRNYMLLEGYTPAQAAAERDQIGAEVRFDYDVSGYRNDDLAVTSSLFFVDSHGSISSVARDQDRIRATIIHPTSCSDHRGYDLWISTPDRKRRYRVLLELFNYNAKTNALGDRIDLIETETFQG